MTRNVIVFAAGTLLTAVIVGFALALAHSMLLGAVIIATATPGLIWLHRYDLRREKRESAEHDLRLRELLVLARSPRFSLVVERPTSRRFSGVMIAAGMLFVLLGLSVPRWQQFAQVSAMVLGAILVVAGLAMLRAPRSRPVLTLTKVSIETPSHGTILWEHVHRVDLKSVTVRATRFDYLWLQIPDIRTFSAQFRNPMRWLYRHRPKSWPEVISVRVTGASEAPKVIYGLATALWSDKARRNAGADWRV